MNSHHLTRLGGAGAAAAVALAVLAGPAHAAHHSNVPSRLPRLTSRTPLYDVGVRPHLSRTAAGKKAVPTIQMFHRNVTDGKKTFPYTMVGKNPFKTQVNPTATIPTVVVPIIVVLPNNDTFDPTVADSCAPSSSVARTLASPLFNNKAYTWGGTSVGTGQYLSVFRRAEFRNQTAPTGANPGYQVTLSQTTASPITVNVPPADAAEFTISCGRLAAMSIAWWDNFLRTTLMPQLATTGVGSGDFVLFELNDVVMYNGSPSSGCCILGYHNAFTNPADGGTTTYGTAMFDNTHGAFTGSADISVLTHEIGEWMDDPLVDGVNNNTKPWGNIGQVSGCQTNLEVGDPLSGTLQPVNFGGTTWHPQELAFFSWFYHQKPSIGVNGWYSSHGTFTTPAAKCP